MMMSWLRIIVQMPPFRTATLLTEISTRGVGAYLKGPPIRKATQMMQLFKLKTHGICRYYVRKYIYKCKMPNCSRKFKNACDWNSHHHLWHGSLFWCEICHKTYPSPSSFRDHQYMHRDTQYKCMQCNCSFLFLSGVKNHKWAHLQQWLFKCFAGRCKHAFKHPQDLHLDIGLHIGKQFKCDKCEHSTYQAPLLQRHQVVHQLTHKYSCEFCKFKTKYQWSLDRHWKRKHQGNDWLKYLFCSVEEFICY